MHETFSRRTTEIMLELSVDSNECFFSHSDAISKIIYRLSLLRFVESGVLWNIHVGGATLQNNLHLCYAVWRNPGLG